MKSGLADLSKFVLDYRFFLFLYIHTLLVDIAEGDVCLTEYLFAITGVFIYISNGVIQYLRVCSN